jgi:hypothetical protein
MVALYGRSLTRGEVEASAGQLSQFAGVQLLRYEDGPAAGVRVLEFRSGSGLRFTALPDRAFDIHDCEHNGRAVGWQSPVGVRHPALVELGGEGGLGWLRGFSGLLATCGLDHYGFMDSESAAHFHYPARKTVEYGLHGRIANTPGRLLGYGEVWDGDECTLFCEGEVRQATMFGENLVLHRRIEVAMGGDQIVIRDRVSNAGYYRTPHMLLYHVNLGYPVIAEGSRYLAPVAEVGWASHAADLRHQGVGYRICPAPRNPFVEQVWAHRMQAGTDGIVPVAVVNDALGFGVLLETRKAELPCHLQWCCFQKGLYGMGIEPGTNHIDGHAASRQRGELIELEHCEARSYVVRLSVLDGGPAIARAEARVRAAGPQPDTDYPAPSGVREALGRGA